jgi:hypothetical protein
LTLTPVPVMNISSTVDIPDFEIERFIIAHVLGRVCKLV